MPDEFDVMLGEFLTSPAENMTLLLLMADWLEDHPEKGEGRPLAWVLRAHVVGGWAPADLRIETHDEGWLEGDTEGFFWGWHDRDRMTPTTMYYDYNPPAYSVLPRDLFEQIWLFLGDTRKTRAGEVTREGGGARQRYRSQKDAFLALWDALERQGTEAHTTSETSGRQSNVSRQISM